MLETLDIYGKRLQLEPLKGGRWRLLRDFMVCVDGEIIVVPAGTITNLASTPRSLWSFWPPFGPWMEAAVVHDFLWDRDGPNARANRIFRKLLKQSGNNIARRWLFWSAVTCGMWWRIGTAKIRETASNL